MRGVGLPAQCATSARLRSRFAGEVPRLSARRWLGGAPGTDMVRTLVGKSDAWQVANVMQTTNKENVAMVEESVLHGVGMGREVSFDAEHFCDGYARDAEYAVEVCISAARAGASWVVVCDTNGGSQPALIR